MGLKKKKKKKMAMVMKKVESDGEKSPLSRETKCM